MKPIEGVTPPPERSLHSSIDVAPALYAVYADIESDKHTSMIAESRDT